EMRKARSESGNKFKLRKGGNTQNPQTRRACGSCFSPFVGVVGKNVAQICNLLYRRFAIDRRPNSPLLLHQTKGQQIENLRYSRLQICATTLLATALAGCSSAPPSRNQVAQQPFGQTKDGTEVYLFTLRNAHGAEARISNYGGIVTSIKVPDHNGNLGDVV